ncbi:VanZ family protein [Curtobacterium caseinilyticum]|uniref:VanZ family protein n=1 Tax=Curtobacterium caseinilyticum TaxID=3055137 RepID=A0ABT7TQT0_9MICO|nr:VanZ family protein [Curtobacterium caseinilyticum]MDM7891952.1 VanZ family protein [Curtobacterium caseinilyticum]
MGTATRTTIVRSVLCAAVVLVVALVLVPGTPDRLRSGLVSGVSALRALGHGTLAVGDGFVLAMLVTLVTMPLPVLLAGATRASRPLSEGVRHRALVSGGVVLVLAGVVASQAAAPGERFRSVALAGLVGVALGSLLDAAWHARERAAHASGRTQRVAWTLAAAYGLVVVLVATAGSPVDGAVYPHLVRAIAAGQRLGAPGWLGYDAVEFTANVVFFVPFGFFVLLLFGARAWWAGMLGGFVVSCAIETVQALFLPARFASVDDVLANTSGAVLGMLVGIVVLGRARRS